MKIDLLSLMRIARAPEVPLSKGGEHVAFAEVFDRDMTSEMAVVADAPDDLLVLADPTSDQNPELSLDEGFPTELAAWSPDASATEVSEGLEAEVFKYPFPSVATSQSDTRSFHLVEDHKEHMRDPTRPSLPPGFTAQENAVKERPPAVGFSINAPTPNTRSEARNSAGASRISDFSAHHGKQNSSFGPVQTPTTEMLATPIAGRVADSKSNIFPVDETDRPAKGSKALGESTEKPQAAHWINQTSPIPAANGAVPKGHEQRKAPASEAIPEIGKANATPATDEVGDVQIEPRVGGLATQDAPASWHGKIQQPQQHGARNQGSPDPRPVHPELMGRNAGQVNESKAAKIHLSVAFKAAPTASSRSKFSQSNQSDYSTRGADEPEIRKLQTEGSIVPKTLGSRSSVDRRVIEQRASVDTGRRDGAAIPVARQKTGFAAVLLPTDEASVTAKKNQIGSQTEFVRSGTSNSEKETLPKVGPAPAVDTKVINPGMPIRSKLVSGPVSEDLENRPEASPPTIDGTKPTDLPGLGIEGKVLEKSAPLRRVTVAVSSTWDLEARSKPPAEATRAHQDDRPVAHQTEAIAGKTSTTIGQAEVPNRSSETQDKRLPAKDHFVPQAALSENEVGSRPMVPKAVRTLARSETTTTHTRADSTTPELPTLARLDKAFKQVSRVTPKHADQTSKVDAPAAAFVQSGPEAVGTEQSMGSQGALAEVKAKEIGLHSGPLAPIFPPTITQAVPLTKDPILDQVRDAVQQNPGGPIEITLKPEELGRVRIQVIAADNGVNLSIVTDRPETMDLLRRHIDQLAQDYRQMGYDRISFSFAAGGDQRGSEGQKYGQTQAWAQPESLANMPESPPPEQIASDGIDIRL